MGLIPAKKPADPVQQEVAVVFKQLPDTADWLFDSIYLKTKDSVTMAEDPMEKANAAARKLSEEGYHTHVVSTVLGRDNPNGH